MLGAGRISSCRMAGAGRSAHLAGLVSPMEPAPMEPATSPATPTASAPLRAWDPLVRLTHWGIVLAVLLNALVTEEGDVWHVWVGTAMAALLVLRLIWGLVGPAEARFSAFPPSPARAIAHVRDILAGRHARHASHNGLGALMAYAIWATLAVIAASGLAMSGFPPAAKAEREAVQATAFLALEAPARASAGEAHEEDEAHERAEAGTRAAPGGKVEAEGEGEGEGGERMGGEGGEDALEEIHEGAVNFLYLLIALHLAGVAFETVRSGPAVLRRMAGRSG